MNHEEASRRGGSVHDTEDDLGYKASQNSAHAHAIHAPSIDLISLDHQELTRPYSKRVSGPNPKNVLQSSVHWE